MINTPLFSGKLGFVNDPNLLQSLMNPNTKILFVGDVLGYEDVIRYFQMITATSLSPDYNALALDVDGDIQGFKNKYFDQLLNSPPSSTFICTILAAMHQGKDIIIFFPSEANGLHYPAALGEYFMMFHGIQPALGNIPFMYNCQFDSANASILYYYELIRVEEYLAYSIPQDTIKYYSRIASDMGIPLNLNQPESVADFEQRIGRYMNSMQSDGAIRICPFTVSIQPMEGKVNVVSDGA